LTRIGPLFDSDRTHSAETRDSFAEAVRICARLREAGHIAYFAGGCVRDALLGREPKDFDVATDATPDRVREIFGMRQTLAFGASFGVIGVLPLKGKKQEFQMDRRNARTVLPTEVATFRSDGDYSDGRRPDKVHYGDARHDAMRRDFTINGLFFDTETERVIDYVGGQQDLAAGRLRTIGEAGERFEEDKLRMLRAARFATTLGFSLDPSTKAEMIARADEISVVSAERIGAEMRRIVVSVHAKRGLDLLVECGLDRLILPEVRFADAEKLNRFLNSRNIWKFDSSMALILLPIAENPASSSAASLIRQQAKLWRFSNEETRRILAAVDRWSIIAHANERRWSSVQPLLIDRDVDCVIEVAAAIAKAEGIDPSGVALCREALGRPDEDLNPTSLINGETLRAAGYRPGPQFRDWLQASREAQLDGIIATESEALEFVSRLSTDPPSKP
jgi:tRNA nucleotidyltransferase (CCA-adding enzyme)